MVTQSSSVRANAGCAIATSTIVTTLGLQGQAATAIHSSLVLPLASATSRPIPRPSQDAPTLNGSAKLRSGLKYKRCLTTSRQSPRSSAEAYIKSSRRVLGRSRRRISSAPSASRFLLGFFRTMNALCCCALFVRFFHLRERRINARAPLLRDTP